MRWGIVIAVMLMAVGSAVAQPGASPIGDPTRPLPSMPPPPPGSYGGPAPAHVHDGLYARAQLSIGSMKTRYEAAGGDGDLTGGGVNISLAAGTALTRNWILYAEMFNHGAIHPRQTVNGDEGEADDELTVNYFGLGAGVAYFVGESGFYASGTLAGARLTFDREVDGTVPYQSPLGPAIVLQVGRDWWMSDQWTLGVAARLFAGRTPSTGEGMFRDDGFHVSGLSVGVVVGYN